jgi:hypothetical protein
VQKKSIIEIVRDKRRDLVVDQHIAEITGKKYHPRPNHFRNKETGEEYYAIAGGLAFPARPAPGFGVIVGAVKGDDIDQPILKTLDDFEGHGLEDLLTTAEQRRHKWGYPDTLLYYYGDPERFLESIYAFNERLGDGKGTRTDLFLGHPADFGDPHRTEIFLEQIYSLLRPSTSGTKRLFLGECKLLRAHLQNIPVGITAIEESPAVAALGYAVHSLMTMRPWLVFTHPERTIPTDGGVWAEVFGSWDDRAPWDEECDESDRNDLMPTLEP